MDKPVTENQVKKMIKDAMANNYKSGTPAVARHHHDGNDNIKIEVKNLIYNNKLSTFITANQPSTAIVASNDLVVLSSGIYNPTKIAFYGIARTPISTTATTKVLVNAVAELGNCFRVTQTIIKPAGVNVVYANDTSTFEHVGGAWVPTVNADGEHFISIFDGSFNLVAYIDVDSWSNTSITLKSVVSPNWQIQGNLIIT